MDSLSGQLQLAEILRGEGTKSITESEILDCLLLLPAGRYCGKEMAFFY
jgi:hypothetical protein